MDRSAESTLDQEIADIKLVQKGIPIVKRLVEVLIEEDVCKMEELGAVLSVFLISLHGLLKRDADWSEADIKAMFFLSLDPVLQLIKEC